MPKNTKSKSKKRESKYVRYAKEFHGLGKKKKGILLGNREDEKQDDKLITDAKKTGRKRALESIAFSKEAERFETLQWVKFLWLRLSKLKGRFKTGLSKLAKSILPQS